MGSWRTRLMGYLAARCDADLKQAMSEISVEDTTGRPVPDGIIFDIAAEIAPLAQTQPAQMMGLVTRAVILHAACRFAGIEPSSRRI